VSVSVAFRPARAVRPVLAGPVGGRVVAVLGPLLLAVSLAALVLAYRAEPAWFAMVDLRVYRAGGAAALHGTSLYAGPMVGTLPFTYPPFAAAVFAPAALLGWGLARLLSAALWLGCLWAVVRMSLDTALRRRASYGLIALVTAGTVWLEPVRGTLGLGQVNLLLVALVLADLTGRSGRLPRGVLIGIATGIKLTPGIFAIYLLLTGRRRAAGTALGTFAATAAFGWLLLPGDSVKFWSLLWWKPEHVGGVPYVGNQSLNGFFTRILHGTEPARLPWLAAALLVACLGLAIAAATHRAGRELAGIGLVGLVGVLVSPISWSHHWVWVLPGTIAAGAATFSWARLARLVAWTAPLLGGVIWLMPNTGNREYGYHGWQLLVGNAYLAAGLAVLGLAGWRVRGSLGRPLRRRGAAEAVGPGAPKLPVVDSGRRSELPAPTAVAVTVRVGSAAADGGRQRKAVEDARSGGVQADGAERGAGAFGALGDHALDRRERTGRLDHLPECLDAMLTEAGIAEQAAQCGCLGPVGALGRERDQHGPLTAA
jgi:alpha-1,2-mannosyltransferase